MGKNKQCMAYCSILSTNQKHVDEPNNNLKDSESFKFKSKFTNDTDVTGYNSLIITVTPELLKHC